MNGICCKEVSEGSVVVSNGGYAITNVRFGAKNNSPISIHLEQNNLAHKVNLQLLINLLVTWTGNTEEIARILNNSYHYFSIQLLR